VKVRRKWPDDVFQKRVRRLAIFFAAEWKACADGIKSNRFILLTLQEPSLCVWAVCYNDSSRRLKTINY
jgi:hypothetical protein